MTEERPHRTLIPAIDTVDRDVDPVQRAAIEAGARELSDSELDQEARRGRSGMMNKRLWRARLVVRRILAAEKARRARDGR